MKTIHCIINPASGKREPVLDILNEVLRPKGIRWDVSVTQDDGDAKGLAEAAVANDQYDAIAVYGGDGTISEAAAGCVHQHKPLMILPGGTSNLIAADLGILSDTEAALHQLTDERVQTQRIDTGLVNGEVFSYVISIGAGADVILDTPRSVKNIAGPMGYYLAGMQKMHTHPNYQFRFTIDGKEYTETGVAILVMNSAQISVGLQLVDGASMMDGSFDVVLIRQSDLSTIMEFLTRKVNPAIPPQKILSWRGKEISIETDSAARFSIDDQAQQMRPLEITVVPSSLPVLIPVS